jgi:hypothetical protein
LGANFRLVWASVQLRFSLYSSFKKDNQLEFIETGGTGGFKRMSVRRDISNSRLPNPNLLFHRIHSYLLSNFPSSHCLLVKFVREKRDFVGGLGVCDHFTYPMSQNVDREARKRIQVLAEQGVQRDRVIANLSRRLFHLLDIVMAMPIGGWRSPSVVGDGRRLLSPTLRQPHPPGHPKVKELTK